jgi:exopolysaccharide biosynthesis protein
VRRAKLAHEVDETGEVVVFDETGNRLLMLNQVGAAVWLLIDGQRTGRDIAALIVENLGGERMALGQVEDDVQAFVGSLVEHGVVELVS